MSESFWGRPSKVSNDKYTICSYFYDEETDWGWKHGFTLNKEITKERFLELLQIMENELNQNHENERQT